MSLGIIFKGTEGIILAADSRVTLTAEMKQQKNQTMILPSTFDNATKLLRFNNQSFMGAVTYGLGAIGLTAPRTAHSYLPEFDFHLKNKKKDPQNVKKFSKELSDFFLKQWKNNMPDNYNGPDMAFLVGGYDKGAQYGRVFEIHIPNNPEPKEWHVEKNNFGPVWGGQLDFTSRLIQGYDPKLLSILKDYLKLSDEQIEDLTVHLRKNLSVSIPYQFLSLQDCVNLSMFLIKSTIAIQSFYVGVRGVGGSIDVATITRNKEFTPIQEKIITGKNLQF